VGGVAPSRFLMLLQGVVSNHTAIFHPDVIGGGFDSYHAFAVGCDIAVNATLCIHSATQVGERLSPEEESLSENFIQFPERVPGEVVEDAVGFQSPEDVLHKQALAFDLSLFAIGEHNLNNHFKYLHNFVDVKLSFTLIIIADIFGMSIPFFKKFFWGFYPQSRSFSNFLDQFLIIQISFIIFIFNQYKNIYSSFCTNFILDQIKLYAIDWVPSNCINIQLSPIDIFISI
jgi:hypothetical protein